MEDSQVIVSICVDAERVGGAAHTQHLATETTLLRTIDQHTAAFQAKAILPKSDQAVFAKKANGAAVKKQFCAANARTNLLALGGRCVNSGWLAINKDFLAFDKSYNLGGIEWSGLDWRKYR